MNRNASTRYAQWFSYWWDFKLTTVGKALTAGIIVSTIGAMTTPEIPLYQLVVCQGMVGALVFALSVLIRPRIEATPRYPEQAVAGQRLVVTFAIRNVSRIFARDISVNAFALPVSIQAVNTPSVLTELAPGGSGEVSFEVCPLRRGVYSWSGVRVYSTFPFGLFRTGTRMAGPNRQMLDSRLLVYPAFTPIHSISVPISPRYQPGGISLSSNVGESPEYIGNREYQPGDSTRRLEYRSWARLGKPVVKEYQEEYYCRVALVLDTFVPGRQKPGPAGFPALEAAISLSAAIADALARGEYIIDLFAAGPELYVFRSGRHTAHFENVLEILASVDACRSNPFRRVTPALQEELANISSVIGVFLDWDEDRARLVQSAAEAGCSLKVLIVRDGPTTLPCTADIPGGSIAQYDTAAIRSGGLEVI